VIRFLLACLAGVSIAHAQEYPTRPVKIVVPNAPGASIDTLARIIAARLGEPLGQPIVVENRAGAAGVLGMETGRSAAPDGYTLVLASASNLSIAPLAQKSVPYDPLNDFAFVSTIALLPNVLVVHKALPVNSVKELLEHARANPGKLNMSSAGPGSASHLGGVLLQVMAGFESLHVPYKGGGPSMAALVSGESHWSITPAPAAMALVQGGRLRAIAQSPAKRSPLLAEVPSIAETVPGYDYSGWAGLVAPKATPAPALAKVRAALSKTLLLTEVRTAFAAQGAEVMLTTPEEFRAFLARDLEATARIMKAAGIKPE
jgi:tripartite-type tricarboxylate transporter receptor subunit TctC